MKILLDTHTLFWSVEEPAKLSADALAAISDAGNRHRFLSGCDSVGNSR